MDSTFKLSADSSTIAFLLRQAQIGDVVTYEAISEAIGRDVRENCMGALQTARSLVQRENRMVFDVVRKIGLKRLDNDSIVDLSDRAREQARRLAKRTSKKLVCVDYDSLSREKQTKHNASLSVFSCIAELSTNKAQARLSKTLETSSMQVPAAKAALLALGAEA